MHGVYEIDCGALRQNIRAVLKRAQGVPVWAVVKGDGYGLGLEMLAGLLRQEGITRFCTADAREALTLAGAECQVLLLQPTQDRALLGQLIKAGVLCTVSGPEDGDALERTAAELGCTARVHVKIDTGLGRYGFSPRDTRQLLRIYRELPHMEVTGIYTHFSDAWNSGRCTRHAFRLFCGVLDRLRAAGIDPGQAHCCNSAAFFRWPQMYLDGVRIGSAFLGRQQYRNGPPLQRVGVCRSRIEELRWLRPGEKSGYGGSFRAIRRTRLALIPMGYWHGFGVTAWPHRGKNRLTVSINGVSCPVRSIGMTYTAADVSKLPCQPGDPVLLEISPLYQKGLETAILP